MGGGIIIQQRAALRTLANDPAIHDCLTGTLQSVVSKISSKGLDDWTASDDFIMRRIPIFAALTMVD